MAHLVPVITRDPDLVRAAQGLRHDVFVAEQGARPGPGGLEVDAFDGGADHLVLQDAARPDLGVVATTRIARGARYTAREFDMGALLRSDRPLAEMGRTCLHPDYRGGSAAFALMQAALDHVSTLGAEILVGTASFPGAHPEPHLPALRRLALEALAPPAFRPVATGPHAITIAGAAPRAAMQGVPSLIKSYIRAGAWVGEGAWCDRAFNTVDICIVLDLARLRLPQVPAVRILAQA